MPGKVAFTVSLFGSDLVFDVKAAVASHPHPDASEGQRFEGLWEGDVIELFLAAPDGRYLEINLATNCAWWACHFDSPRSRSQEPAPLCRTSRLSDGVLRLATSVEWLSKSCNPCDLRWNVTAILHRQACLYSSAAPLSWENPDFHQPESFLPFTGRP